VSAAPIETVAAPAVPLRRPSGLLTTLAHARYVVGDNPVTGFSFGLLLVLVLCALLAGC
jgi:peptide/nickel transport system permease protein